VLLTIISSILYSETGELYIIAANSSGSFELYIINLADGSATYIGPSSYTPSAFAIAGDYIIPVELTSFTADVINSIIELRWKTATEINNSGFQVEKRTENSDWNNIAFVPGFGTSTETHSYSYSDQSVVSGNYSYRLKQIDYDGSFEYSKIVEVEVESPTRFSLSQNYPNPFNPVAAIKYQIPELSFVTIKVYDVLGNEITTLFYEEKPAGSYEIEFDASSLPSGIYFYRLQALPTGRQAGSFVETKKMILMK